MADLSCPDVDVMIGGGIIIFIVEIYRPAAAGEMWRADPKQSIPNQASIK